MQSTENPLQTQVQFLKGCGPHRAELLKKLGVETVGDLLWYLPRDVLDLTDVRDARQLEADVLQTVRGTVVDLDARQVKGGKTLAAVLLDCDGEYVRGMWFNQPWMLQKFAAGALVLFSGKPKRHGGRWQMAHPRVQFIEQDDFDTHGGLLPRYPLTDGLKIHELRRIIRTAVEQFAESISDPLPQSFCEKLGLPTLVEAIQQVHLPRDMASYEAARRRLIFDDLFEFQLGLALRSRVWKRSDAPVLETTPKIDARIRRLFPFKLTAGQDAAIRDIVTDLGSSHAMHRLLQADVGAGKTAVAVYAMLVAVAAGYQCALMAPTEVLAQQHWATIDRLLAHSRVKRLLLTGNLTSAQRKAALASIREGEVQLVVGTQALIQKDVKFSSLGLAVIDEQHKFGVAQRAQFSDAKISPHVLVMTATPIPRSLCLTQFGDLDFSQITDMPPGRQRVMTSHVVGEAARLRMWQFIRDQLRTGRQAYIVCPRVESANDGDADESSPRAGAAAEETFKRLSAGELKDVRLGLVHGQMDRDKKAAVMESFRAGETQALVSTTVIEVGVDIPNATLLVVLDANRFGLSQLHQLRGRISRGKFQGYCFLLSDSESEDAYRRLAMLEKTSDGFEIAELDFELRGPGDVLGTRQHGDTTLKVADLRRDTELLTQSRETAFRLVQSGEFDTPPFAALKSHVLERFAESMHIPKSG